MNYASAQNRQRADHGFGLVKLHPDFGRMTDTREDELLTAASDSIADILHALNAEGVLGERRKNLARAYEVLDRAIRGYEGDFEDERDV